MVEHEDRDTSDVKSQMATIMQHRSISSTSQGDIAADLLQAAAQASAQAAEEDKEDDGDEQDSSGESLQEDRPALDRDDGLPPVAKRRKRSRACQACRQMKIRCDALPGQDACKSCFKVNRQCVMPGPARKRQKTVHKVAELEKKINALTQSLLTRTQPELTPQQSPTATNRSDSIARYNTEPAKVSSSYDTNMTCGASGVSTATFPFQHQSADDSYVDVVQRGIIQMSTASCIFETFVSDMAPLCPIVAYPAGTTAEMVRRSRPMTFLAVLTAGSPLIAPDLCSRLGDELAKQLSERINFYMERSLDLVQASLVQAMWVGKHRLAKDMGFNHYIHGAIVMAHELGIGKRLKVSLARNQVEEAEMRRTWLACLYGGCCISTTLRQPAMIRSSPYVHDCLKFFASSSAALPTDAVLCALTELILIMEDVAQCFSMDDPQFVINIEDGSVQYQLKAFEARLREWRRGSHRRLDSKLLHLLEPIASLYIHEIALHTDHNVDDFKPGDASMGEESHTRTDYITHAHIPAITSCVVAMKSALEAFISISEIAIGIRSLPSLYLVWTAYALVAMIRLSGTLRTTNSKYADVYLPDLKIDYYLDAIIDKLTKGAGSVGPIAMFLQAFQKLKIWHQYRLMGIATGHEPTVTGAHTSSELVTKTQAAHQDFTGHRNPSRSVAGRLPNSMSNEPGDLVSSIPPVVRDPSSSWNPVGTAGTSWILPDTPQMPIDSSMFANQDWSFTVEEWSNFEASMVQPAAATGGSWLGYLL